MHGLSLDAVSSSYSLVVVHRLLIDVASLVAEHKLWNMLRASIVVVHGLSCPEPHGIFSDQG